MTGWENPDREKRFPYPYGTRRPRISLKAAGGMFLSPPAHLIGAAGSAYKYGTLVVGGTRNLWGDGQVMYPLVPTTFSFGGFSNAISLLLGGTGAGSVDQIQQACYGTPGIDSVAGGASFFLANGEAAFQTTTQLVGHYGAVLEPFTANGTVGVTAGSATINGTSTTWTTDTLSTTYAYTPSGNNLRVGDLLRVVQGSNVYFHRIMAITNATTMTVYPVWQGATGLGLVYTTHRSGYGSRSSIAVVFNSATGLYYAYYAGGFLMQGLTVSGSFTPSTVPAGRIQCVSGNLNAAQLGNSGVPSAHYMGPQNTGATDVYANDVALYKSFLVYGAGNTVGWSVAGFPTSFTTGFGATDFPGVSSAVLDTDAEFVSFELWGDQLVAICEKSLYLIRPTGSVPEFDVQRLPETVGPDKYTVNHPAPSTNIQISSRPTCTAKGQIYMVTPEGLVRFDGLAQSVYGPVGPWPWTVPSANQAGFGALYDQGLNLIAMWAPGTAGSHSFLLYSPALDQWWSYDSMDFSGGSGNLMLGSGIRRQGGLQTNPIRTSGLTIYNPTSNLFYRFKENPATEDPNLPFSSVGWNWASPIAYLSDVYGDFNMGGFSVRGRTAFGAPSPTNLTWTLYGGRSPYTMKQRDTGTFDYSGGGTVDARHILGRTVDDPYVAVVLSGLSWIELAGVDIYSSDAPARR